MIKFNKRKKSKYELAYQRYKKSKTREVIKNNNQQTIENVYDSDRTEASLTISDSSIKDIEAQESQSNDSTDNTEMHQSESNNSVEIDLKDYYSANNFINHNEEPIDNDEVDTGVNTYHSQGDSTSSSNTYQNRIMKWMGLKENLEYLNLLRYNEMCTNVFNR